MAVSISIRDDIARAQKRLTDIEQKQIPFATAGAINSTMFEVRKLTIERTGPAAFETRNKRFLSASLRVDKASKRKLTGAVFDRLGRGRLELHAKGGTRRPMGKNLAIPADYVASRRLGSGKIPKRLKPAQILAAPGPRGRKAFVTKFASGQSAIVRRKAGKGAGLDVLYLFERSARIDKSFRFYEDAIMVARKTMPIEFRKAFARAMATKR